MSIANPFLLLLNCQTREIFGASIRARGDVYDTAENVGDFEAKEAEGHVGETLAVFGKLGHVGV